MEYERCRSQKRGPFHDDIKAKIILDSTVHTYSRVCKAAAFMALNMFTRIIQPFRLLLSLEHIMYKK